MWGVNQDPKDSKESPLYAPGTQVLIKVWKVGSPKAQLQPMKGPLPCKTFYPHSTQGTHESSHRRKQKRTLNTPVSPGRSQTPIQDYNWVSFTNTPKIKFLEIRFLRIALKSQHRLAGVVVLNRQEIDLLIPEQGGT